MEPISLDTIKYITLSALKLVVIILAFLFVLTKCAGCDDKPIIVTQDNTSLFAKIKADSLKSLEMELELTLSEAKIDSLEQTKSKVEIKWYKSSKDAKIQLGLSKCDTTTIRVVFRALNDCDSLSNINNKLLEQKDSIIIILKKDLIINRGMVISAREIINNQAEDYIKLEKSSKKELRKQKIKTIGIIIGATLTEVLTIFALK